MKKNIPSPTKLIDDVISEFSLVVEAAKTAVLDSERQKLIVFVRFIEKTKVRGFYLLK